MLYIFKKIGKAARPIVKRARDFLLTRLDRTGDFRVLRPGFAWLAYVLQGKEAENLALLKKSELFDPQWYSEKYLSTKLIDPYLHFLRNGGYKGFAASPFFDCSSYLRLYPDVGRTGLNPLIHFLRYGERERRSSGLTPNIRELIDRTLGELGELDPQLDSNGSFSQALRALPFITSIPHTTLARVWAAIFRDLKPDTEHLVFMSPAHAQDAGSPAGNLVKRAGNNSLSERILVIFPDYENRDSQVFIPDGARILRISDYSSYLCDTDREKIIELIIFALLPASILIVDSQTAWKTIALKGRALRKICAIYYLLSNNFYSSESYKLAVADSSLKIGFEYATKCYVESDLIVRDLQDSLGLNSDQQAKFEILRRPSGQELGDEAPSIPPQFKTIFSNFQLNPTNPTS